ncbi:Pc21g12830 [Penicillium rubens Wisconsin 54-1255]|uniref:Pc21g12830 protein n=2 Tax=Penicillium chrysogenum species complex TaxID=254878 RepID=B6HM23_PENRW|nr:Pc21g12830 [Penicillium rubens Wisconsin 54-1255]
MGVQNVYARKTRSSSTFILVALCFALFTDTFVYGIIVPILPFLLISHGNTDSKDVQKWSSVLLASYGLALLLGSPAVGYFCDKYRTRKAPLVCGFIAMALATVLFISASNIWVLLLARVCQGLSGAVVGVLGLSMIAETSSPEHLGSHMACGSASLTWGMLCGPMTGGFLFSRFGTVGAFGVPMALLVVDIVLRMLIVQEDEDETKFHQQEDSPLLDSVSENTSLSFYHFLHPIMLGLVFSVLVISSILSAIETTLPLYVLDTYHWSSLGAGLVFLPLTIPSVLSIPIAHFVRHFTPRTVVVTGFWLMAVPMIALRWTEANTVHHQVAIISLLFIVGVCLTTVQAIIMGDVSNAVRKIESLHGITEENSSGLGRAYALCNMAFAAGQTLGPMAGGLIKRELGWGVMTLVLGILCLVAGLSSFFSMLTAPPTKGKNKANKNDVEGVL